MLARTRSLLLSTILAAGLGATLSIAAGAQDVIKRSPSEAGGSGLNSQGGQINPGVGVQAPAGSPPGKNDQSGQGDKVGDRAPAVRDTAATNEPIPSPQEARAALFAATFKDALAGEGSAPSPAPKSGDVQKVTGQNSLDPTGASAGHAAIGGALSPGASASGTSGGSGGPATAEGNTTGSGGAQSQPAPAAPKTQANAGDEPRSGPIGALGQTMPAKFSKRNDTLDRLPTMAWPLAISDEDRQKVYQAVMADSGAAADVGQLRPADQLPTQLALNAMHPLPQSLGTISDINKLAYVKGKDKVLLVTRATSTVVDVIGK